jgi:hypothetical protein
MSSQVFVSHEWYTFTHGSERFRYRIENASDTSEDARRQGAAFFAVPDKQVQLDMLQQRRNAENQNRMLTLTCPSLSARCRAMRSLNGICM